MGQSCNPPRNAESHASEPKPGAWTSEGSVSLKECAQIHVHAFVRGEGKLGTDFQWDLRFLFSQQPFSELITNLFLSIQRGKFRMFDTCSLYNKMLLKN